MFELGADNKPGYSLKEQAKLLVDERTKQGYSGLRMGFSANAGSNNATYGSDEHKWYAAILDRLAEQGKSLSS